MPPRRSNAPLSLKTSNKLKRQDLFIEQKKRRGKEKREERNRRNKEERQDPELRRQRLENNKPLTIDKKRVWDDVDDDSLGVQVNVEELRRRRLAAEQAAELEDMDEDMEGVEGEGDGQQEEDGYDSMLEEDSDEEQLRKAVERKSAKRKRDGSVAPSIAPSTTSTALDLAPTSLVVKFPTLFAEDAPTDPKILITTGLRSTLHEEAGLLCTLFPNSTYVPRSSHRYGHKYSLREISKFAANRDYTTVVLLHEDQKKPSGLSIVHLPAGPTLTFSITPGSWMAGKKLPGHGNPTDHWPELLLNGFSTPLGVLTARVLTTLFPVRPEFEGRQVVCFHNQRDFIFVRRHRYMFKNSAKSMADEDGKPMAGLEGIRAGLQELGPRFTMKLRRVDKGVGWAGSEGEDAVQWAWKAGMEKDRKRFNL
ncbi:related to RNA processing factor 1 [Cephalotrichum gorgonifer]|uniref:Related to RNA processing factor 1 n=1 Tax=Cephalotrichum gorgonifer TaxID=2041049 RepID=A0AAE8N0Q7_9PEZI|nr:related to RNA processing factor 1 [Cephalotrichum gorgonifer]